MCFERLWKADCLIIQDHYNPRRVVIGLNVERIGLDLSYHDIMYVCEKIAESLINIRGSVDWEGKIWKTAKAEKGRVIIYPF